MGNTLDYGPCRAEVQPQCNFLQKIKAYHSVIIGREGEGSSELGAELAFSIIASNNSTLLLSFISVQICAYSSILLLLLIHTLFLLLLLFCYFHSLS